MAPAIWLSLLATSAVISFTPGAGAINTMTNALTVGWRRSIWGVAGQQLALLLHIVIAAAGVGVLVAGSPVIFNAIRYAGAAYLVYLGLRMILARPAATGRPAAAAEGRSATAGGDERAGSGTGSAWSLMRRGFWVNLLNPKAIVFFLAFLPQFIRVDRPLLPQYTVLTATVVLVDVLVMWFFFAAAAKPFRRYASTERGQRVVNRLFGGLFIAVAALLLFAH